MATMQTIRTMFVLVISLQLALAECPAGSPCKASSGIFPVPGDCSSFFNCAHCRAYQQQCGPGTLFDPELRVCNHAHKVQCGQSSGSAEFSGSQFVARSGRLDERRAYPTQRPPFNPQPAAAALPVHPEQPHGQISSQREPNAEIKQSDNIFDEGSYRTTPRHQLTQTGQVSLPPDQHPSQKNKHNLNEQDAERQSGRRISVHGRTRFPPIASQYPFEGTFQNGQSPAGAQKAPTQHAVSSRTRVISLSDESDHQNAEDQSSGFKQSGALKKETSDEQPLHGDGHSETQNTAKQIGGGGQTPPLGAAGRRRYDHPHLSHHPEASAYLSTHEIVFDHSHNTHHLHHNEENVQNPDHQFVRPHHEEADAVSEQMQPSRYHGNPELPEYSRNNRGYMVPSSSRSPEQEPDKKFPVEAAPPTTSHAVPQTTFDLKNRQQSSSGYVPSVVRGEMADDEEPRRKSHDYGERVFVRRPNTSNRHQETPKAEIVDMKGQPVEPERFYVDEDDTIRSFDEDSNGNPTDVTEEDLRRIIANQQHQERFVPSTESRWTPQDSERQRHRQFQSQNRQPQNRAGFNPTIDASGRPSYSTLPKEESPDGLTAAASVTSAVHIPPAY